MTKRDQGLFHFLHRKIFKNSFAVDQGIKAEQLSAAIRRFLFGLNGGAEEGLERFEDFTRHESKAVVVGMNVIHGAGVNVVVVKAFAADQVDVPISRGFGILVRSSDDGEALFIFFGVQPVVGVGEHDDGKLGVAVSDHAEEGLVRFLEMLCVGRIIIVIHDENAHSNGGDEFCHLRLALCTSGKSEIDIIHIEPAGERRVVSVSDTARAAALGDGGAVENDGLSVGVGRGCFDIGIVVNADINVFQDFVLWHKYRDIGHFAVERKRFFGFVRVGSAQSRGKNASEKNSLGAVSDVNVKTGGGNLRYEAVPNKGFGDELDVEVLRIGAKAHSAARAAASELAELRQCLHDLLGQAHKASVPIKIHQSVYADRRIVTSQYFHMSYHPFRDWRLL